MEFPHNKKNKKKGKSSRKGEYSSNVPMSSSVPPPAVKIEDKLLLRAALKSAADSGAFMDTKFYAFSRRDPSRKVYEPKAVYANGWLLRARVPSYFEPLLAGGYKESTVGSLHGNFPSNQPASNSEYGYDSDSDLEDDEEEEGGIITLMASRLEECMTGETLQPEKDAGDKTIQHTGQVSEETKEHPTGDVHGSGRVVILRDFAYPTWKALIFYLCTGEVAFATLRSQKKESTPVISGQISPDAPLCSPKSMYRIADQLGLDVLKDLAEKDILSKLTAENILDELFSEFTSLYDKIRDMEVQFAYDKALTHTAANISEWIDRTTSGEHPYNAAVLKCLFQKFSGSAPKTDPKPTYCGNCGRRDIPLKCGSCNVAGYLQ